jgi:hypothetical protein
MKVAEIINHAKYGELKQLSLKTDTDALLSYINLGLIELYKRFNLSIKVEIIQTVPEVKVYNLRNKDIGSVLIIYNSKGEKLRYKRISSDTDYEIAQLTPTSFLFKAPIEEEILFLYKANPPTVTSSEDEIELPYDMLEALLYYIGHKGQSSINKQSNMQVPTVNFYSMFEKSCYELEQRGYSMDLLDIETDIRDKGFV